MQRGGFRWRCRREFCFILGGESRGGASAEGGIEVDRPQELFRGVEFFGVEAGESAEGEVDASGGAEGVWVDVEDGDGGVCTEGVEGGLEGGRVERDGEEVG